MFIPRFGHTFTEGLVDHIVHVSIFFMVVVLGMFEVLPDKAFSIKQKMELFVVVILWKKLRCRL